jgi:hypothetical protein
VAAAVVAAGVLAGAAGVLAGAAGVLAGAAGVLAGAAGVLAGAAGCGLFRERFGFVVGCSAIGAIVTGPREAAAASLFIALESAIWAPAKGLEQSMDRCQRSGGTIPSDFVHRQTTYRCAIVVRASPILATLC